MSSSTDGRRGVQKLKGGNKVFTRSSGFCAKWQRRKYLYTFIFLFSALSLRVGLFLQVWRLIQLQCYEGLDFVHSINVLSALVFHCIFYENQCCIFQLHVCLYYSFVLYLMWWNNLRKMTGGRLSFVITDGERACRVKKKKEHLTNVKSAVNTECLTQSIRFGLKQAEQMCWFWLEILLMFQFNITMHGIVSFKRIIFNHTGV